VTIVGNEIYLQGGSNITIKMSLFEGYYKIIHVIDEIGSIVEVEAVAFYDSFLLEQLNLPSCTAIRYDSGYSYGVFENCVALVTVNLPSVIYLEDAAFYDCVNLQTVNAPIVEEIGSYNDYGVFAGCESITSVNFPQATIIGIENFYDCTSLTTINLSSCTNLGPTVGDNDVFYNIIGNTITLTIPAALMTANAGSPDGDIVYLQANNTVTIVTV
jgi:hypothetical protein